MATLNKGDNDSHNNKAKYDNPSTDLLRTHRFLGG